MRIIRSLMLFFLAGFIVYKIGKYLALDFEWAKDMTDRTENICRQTVSFVRKIVDFFIPSR